MLRRLLCLLVLALLGGCEPNNSTEMLDDYATRVSRAIDWPIELQLKQAVRQLPTLPRRRERLLEMTDIRAGLIEAWSMRRCHLLHLVGKRNSSLGKLASKPERLVYDLKMIPALQACQQSLTDSDNKDDIKLRREVSQILAIKQQEFPRELWNTFYTTPEMEQQFSLSSEALDFHQPDTLANLPRILSRFKQLTQLSHQNGNTWQLPFPADSVIDDFEELNRNRFGGQWLIATALLTDTLNRTANAINARLDKRPLCFDQRPNNQARIVRNVFGNFYAGQVQPYLAAVERQGDRWKTSQQELLQSLPMPDSTRHYFTQLFDDENSIWSNYQEARERHTHAWQRLLTQCGLMPGQ